MAAIRAAGSSSNFHRHGHLWKSGRCRSRTDSCRANLYDIGGGIPNDKKLKAVQTGGPSGGCLPARLLHLPVDYEALAEAGAIMGSGGMVIMDEQTCMVEMARYFLTFTHAESCGKCLPCRLGTRQLLAILEDICAGRGRP